MTMSPFFAETIGTALLLLLGNGAVANVLLTGTKGQNSGWMAITTAWALAVFVAVSFSAPISGAHLNPAVTIGLTLAGKFPWSAVLPYILAQCLGAGVGSCLAWVFYNDHFKKTNDHDLILAVFCTSPAIPNRLANFFCEVIGSFVLMFSILYFTEAKIIETNDTVGLGTLGALPVALLVWSIGLSLGGTTGYALNPARDLIPRLVHSALPIPNKGKSNWPYAWIPVIGPVTGTSAASFFYLLI